MTEIPVSKYVKIPWADRGRGFDGCDCYGLVMLILAAEFNKHIPDFEYDKAAANNADLIDLGKPTIKATEVESPEEGDIVVMYRGKHPTHMGIYLDGGFVIHTDRKMGTCCERITGWRLRGRVEGFYRVEED